MYAIYALIDPRDSKPRYVGMTDNVYIRFRDHVYNKDDNHAKNAWIQELREANQMVVMQTLETVEGIEQAKKRESYWIQHYHSLGCHLTNAIIPLHHEIVFVRTVDAKQKVRLGPRMTPAEQKQYVVDLWSTGISKRSICSQVEKYIPLELVDIVLREQHVPMPTFSSSTDLNGQEWRIVRMWKSGCTMSKIIEEEFGVKGGSAFTQRAKQLQALIARFLPDYAVESEA